MKLKMKFFLFCAVFSFLLISCGGGGGEDVTSSDGSQTEASSIDEDAEDLAFAAKETSRQILASEEIDTSDLHIMSTSFSALTLLKEALPISPGSELGLTAESADMIQPLATESGSDSVTGDCGGSMDYTYTIVYDDDDVFPATYDFDFEINDLCITNDEGYEFVYNGTLTMDGVLYTRYTGTLEYNIDALYTSDMPGYESGSADYSETCEISYSTSTCSAGVYDGDTTTYHTSGISVSENASSGYDVSYTIVDSDGNTWSVDFTGLTLCDNGNIGSGSGTVVYNGDLISIDFISCSQFQLTYDGNTETFAQ